MQTTGRETLRSINFVDYTLAREDTLLLGTQCPSFILEMEKVLNMVQVRERLTHYSSLFDHISRSAGIKVQRPSEVALLYAVLETKVRYVN